MILLSIDSNKIGNYHMIDFGGSKNSRNKPNEAFNTRRKIPDFSGLLKMLHREYSKLSKNSIENFQNFQNNFLRNSLICH